jgi:hypothetical protein
MRSPIQDVDGRPAALGGRLRAPFAARGARAKIAGAGAWIDKPNEPGRSRAGMPGPAGNPNESEPTWPPNEPEHHAIHTNPSRTENRTNLNITRDVNQPRAGLKTERTRGTGCLIILAAFGRPTMGGAAGRGSLVIGAAACFVRTMTRVGSMRGLSASLRAAPLMLRARLPVAEAVGRFVPEGGIGLGELPGPRDAAVAPPGRARAAPPARSGL